MTHRTFIAAILAAALAVTGMTAGPARADSDDIAKWIAGAVALGLIGAAIADNNRDNDRAVTRNSGRGFGNPDHGYRKNRHAYQQDQRYLLPKNCRARASTRSGEVRGFERNCLLRNYAHFNSLPHECAVRARGEGRQWVIYQRRCLKQYGFRNAERR
ncbi:MAG: hypothetical protein NXH84_10120 [Rhodobacteraceae bacterium]|nr:hypothetical protein [Paracoccaceae bacterium]